jgi:hypothetical protein
VLLDFREKFSKTSQLLKEPLFPYLGELLRISLKKGTQR